MGIKKIVVPIMQEKDYRTPGSFISYIGHSWKSFLARWNDPNITLAEAKGLLHELPSLSSCADTWPEEFGEDRRETCIRFLLHYASLPCKFDNEWQIVRKARQVLVNKFLESHYIQDTATDELIKDILQYFTADTQERLPDNGAVERKMENFLRMVDETRGKNKKIRGLVGTLVIALFNCKNAAKELRRGRL